MLKSCGTCRSRRRACDKARPNCGTCKKSGHLCTGYAENETKVFVNFDSKNLSRRKKRVLCDAIRDQHQAHVASQDEVSPTVPRDFRPQASLQSSAPSVIRKSPYNTQSELPGILPENDIRVLSLSSMFMNMGQFQQHVTSLWAHFEKNHTMTAYGWAPGFGQLLMHNYALDLALVSLSSLRLAQCSPNDPYMKVMSHSAYDRSIRIFRQICNCRHATWKIGLASNTLSVADRRRLALLSVTTLVYAFFEGTQKTPLTIFRDDSMASDAHLQGCLTFVDAAGPRAFSRGGTHRAFRKIRELSVVTAMVSHKPSILAADRWMNGPWRYHGKTVRDKLYDIITPLTILVAYALHPTSPGHFQAPSWRGKGEPGQEKRPETPVELYLELQRKLYRWYNDWLAAPSVPGVADANSGGKEPLPPLNNCFEEDYDAGYLFMQTEVRALRVLMALVAMKMGPRVVGEENFAADAATPQQTFVLQSSPSSTDESYDDYDHELNEPESCSRMPTAERARRDAMIFARSVRAALDRPEYNLRGQGGPGIVEGQCRSILPTWTLIEYDRVLGDRLMDLIPPDDGDADPLDWL